MENSNKRSFKKDVKQYSPLLWNLALKDIKIKYRRSVLGILWSVLNPLLTMIVLTAVFGMIMKIRVENFATYYIVGISLWNFFGEATSLAMTSILTSAALIKKVYLPKYIFPLEKCIFALINLGFSLVAVLAVMLLQGIIPTLFSLTAILPITYCFIFASGVSLILSALTVYFRDIAHLYGVLLTIWMYLTPIIYPISLISEHKLLITVLKFNPMVYYVELMRNSLMGTPLALFGTDNTLNYLQINLIGFGFAVFTLALGVLVFKKCQKNFILRI